MIMKLKMNIKIFDLYINDKLRWKSHIKEMKFKLIT